MTSPKSIWNHEADKDLLLAIISEGTLKSISWANIATKMEAKNYTFTQEACRQHFQKLRRESGGGAIKDDNASPAKTPKNPKASMTPKSTGKTNGKTTAPGNFRNGHHDDDEEFDTPAAKRKRTIKGEDAKFDSGFEGQNAGLFKIEDFGNPIINLDDEGLYDEEA